MLKDCLDVFSKILADKEIGDKLILDTYVLSNGSYILVDTSKEHFEIKEILEIRYDKKTGKVIGSTNENYNLIKEYDYNSVLIDMNKPIDNKKIIHSNNYLSFFVKKENLEKGGKLIESIIDGYYDILSNPQVKYQKDKESKSLYLNIEEEIGKVDCEKIEKIRAWIKDNIFKIECNAGKKEYVKVFFIDSVEEYAKEGKRYFVPNIYNKNKYNKTIGDATFGLPNDNMGMNDKKPYLDNKSRKITLPYLVNSEDIILQKKFFDYLQSNASMGKNNIYINKNNNIENKKIINALENGNLIKHDFSGIYLKITKEKNEAAIQDFDTITYYKHELDKPMVYKNYLNIDLSKLKESKTPLYSKYNTRSEVQDLIDEVLFSQCLKNNYFTDVKDMEKVKKIKYDSSLKMNLLLSRTSIFNWLYKSNRNDISKIMDKVSLNLVKSSIVNNYLDKAANQFNLRLSLIEFFKGDKKMADFLYDIQNTLRDKINSKDIEKIDNDKEYFFAIGQEVYYLLSLNKSSKKTQSLANPFINAKNNKVIKEKLRNLYKKYNYIIDYNSKRSDKIYSMILGYETEGKVNQDMIIAGFLSNSLIYEKKEGEKADE